MLKKFLKNTSGNFSVMMGASALVLIGGIGLSVDYMAATDYAQQLQAAADGAALAAVLSDEVDESEIRRHSDELFQSLRNQGLTVNSEYVFTDTAITVKAQTTYTPQIMSIFGFGKQNLSVSATVPLNGGGGLDIALVLDVTDSMEENDKIGQMQIAVNGFLNNFQTSTGSNPSLSSAVRVSVVPFSQYVNVGIHNANAPWIDNSQEGTYFAAVTKDTIESTCSTGFYNNPCTRLVDGVTVDRMCRSCDGNHVTTTTGSTTIEPLKTWDGCVGSRAGTLNIQSDFNGTPFPAVYDDGSSSGTPYRDTDYACPRDAVLPLTGNIAAAQTLVGDLDTTGTTYMPSGLAWGWRTLDDDVPLGQPVAGNARKKVLILMTDGFNTVSQRGPDPIVDNDGRYHHGEHDTGDDAGNAVVTAEANTVTANLCTNIEDDDIQIFTIAYEFPDGGDANTARALLRNCAAEDSFFDAADANQLNAAFDAIAKSLKDIRLIN